MPLLRIQRSSSSASLKLWESRTTTFEHDLYNNDDDDDNENNGNNNNQRRSNRQKMREPAAQRLMNQQIDRSDSADAESLTKRRSYGSNIGIGKPVRQYKKLFPERPLPDFVAGKSSSFQIPNEEGIEAVLPPGEMEPWKVPQSLKRYKEPKLPTKRGERPLAQQYSEFPRHTRWSCFPSASHFRKTHQIPHTITSSAPPAMTASSSSEEGIRQERFDQSFELYRSRESFEQQQQQQQPQPQHEPDYAVVANAWNTPILTPAGNGFVDRCLADSTFSSYSSSNASSPPDPDPVALSKQHKPQDDYDNNKKKKNNGDGSITQGADATNKKKPKWKQRLFFWSNSNNKMKRSQSMDQMPTTAISPSTPTRELPNARDWAKREEEEQQENAKWETRVDGDFEVECEYRGDVSVKDWFTARDQSPFVGLNTTADTAAEHVVGTEEQQPPPVGHPEESLLETPSSSSLPSPGVMELGQYAREKRSKAASNSKSKSPSPRSRQKPGILCALPSFGGSSAKAKQSKTLDIDDDDDDDLVNFPDPEFADVEASDDNSYLAVSYTEEGAQLVMQQSGDFSNNDVADYQPLHLHQQQEEKQREALHQQQFQEQTPHVEVSPTGFAEQEFLDDIVDELLLEETDTHMDDSLQYLGQYSIKSASQSQRSGNNKNLGANFPHPAAQLRSDFVQGQPVRPARLDNDDVTPKTMAPRNNSRNENVHAGYTPGSHANPVDNSNRVEKEVIGSMTYHHYKGTGTHLDQTGRPSSATNYTSPPVIRTIQSNSKPPLRQRHQEAWIPPKQHEESSYREPRTSYGLCPTAPPLPTSKYSYPACSSRGMSRWDLSQTTDLTWDQSTTRTMSTLSYSGMYPFQDWRSAATGGQQDRWAIYQPIQSLAKGVNATLCENLYPKQEQPPSVPFDEMEMDYRRKRGTAAPKQEVLRSQSSMSSFYERGYRDYRRPIRSQSASQDSRVRHAESSMESRTTEQPTILTAESDKRRQLL
ncbi:expressed unknown protein [Seminavis robusta]|uniref:Uncharacterized protein n=1 Tax=Seminavis robusta TaxID=568900 RepID=A0A9N8HX20_9STRA|nr:expressed unknown protein [Seminavis robusta]|eukprot:Sro1735_g294340.1 n/a (990) ;mRNA; f:8267-11236